MTKTARNAAATRERIEKAVNEMFEAGCLMAISGVAKEAKVSNATIHNRYPDLAQRIRDLRADQEKVSKQPKQKTGKTKTTKQKMSDYIDKNKSLKLKLANADSVNLALDQKNQSLWAEKEELKCELAEVLLKLESCNKNRIKRL